MIHKSMHIEEAQSFTCQTKTLKALDESSPVILTPTLDNGVYRHFYTVHPEHYTDDMTEAETLLMVDSMYNRIQHLTPVVYTRTMDMSIAHNVFIWAVNGQMHNGRRVLPEDFGDGVLGYTTFLGKFIYMNDAWRWTDGWTNRGENGVQVGAHEIVHTLGVGHSNFRISLMYYLIIQGQGKDTDDFVDYLNDNYGKFLPLVTPPDKGSDGKPDEIAPKQKTFCQILIKRAFKGREHQLMDLSKPVMKMLAGVVGVSTKGDKEDISNRIKQAFRK